MKNKQWMLRAVGVISALALGLGGLAACGNSSSAESKNGRVYYLNKKAEEQSTWVKLGKAFEKETGIPVQIQTGGTDYDATLRSELSKKAAPTMFQADGPSFMSRASRSTPRICPTATSTSSLTRITRIVR